MRASIRTSLVCLGLAAIVAGSCDLGTTANAAALGRFGVTLPQLSTPVGLAAQAGPDEAVTKYVITVYLSRLEQVLLSRIVSARELRDLEAASPGAADAQIEIAFPLPEDALPDDLYGVEVQAYVGSTLAYQMGPASFTLSGPFGQASLVDVQAQYVGPGFDAVSIQTVLGVQTLGVGNTATVACNGLNVQGAPAPVLPAATRLSTSNTAIVVAESRTLIRAVAPGSALVICELDFGTHDTDTISIFVPGGQASLWR